MKKTLTIGILSGFIGSYWWLVVLCLLLLWWFLSRPGTDGIKRGETPREKLITEQTIGIIQALNVGFDHPVFGQYWGFTEDEKTVVDILLENPSHFNEIALRYKAILKEGFLRQDNDLIVDLKEHLDASEYESVKHLWL